MLFIDDYCYFSFSYLMLNFLVDQLKQIDNSRDICFFFGNKKVPLSIFNLDSVLFVLESVGVRGVRVWTNSYVFSFKKKGEDSFGFLKNDSFSKESFFLFSNSFFNFESIIPFDKIKCFLFVRNLLLKLKRILLKKKKRKWLLFNKSSNIPYFLSNHLVLSLKKRKVKLGLLSTFDLVWEVLEGMAINAIGISRVSELGKIVKSLVSVDSDHGFPITLLDKIYFLGRCFVDYIYGKEIPKFKSRKDREKQLKKKEMKYVSKGDQQLVKQFFKNGNKYEKR
jgi:hypothetical protein